MFRKVRIEYGQTGRVLIFRGVIAKNRLFCSIIMENDLKTDPKLNSWNNCNFWNNNQISNVDSAIRSEKYSWFVKVRRIFLNPKVSQIRSNPENHGKGLQWNILKELHWNRCRFKNLDEYSTIIVSRILRAVFEIVAKREKQDKSL